eukprot:1878449-Amphidinium_carterae.4
MQSVVGRSSCDDDKQSVEMPKRVPSPSLMMRVPQTLLRGSLRGHQLQSLCAEALQHCRDLAQCNGADALDADILKLQAHYVAAKDYHHASLVLKAQELCISRFVLQSKLLRLSAGHFVWNRLQRCLAEQHITHQLASPALVLYIDYMSYDETPMKTSVLDQLQVGGDGSWGHDKSFDMGTSTKDGLITVSTSGTAKLLQARQMFCMVLKVGRGHIKLYGESPCHLSVMEKSNAATLAEALQRLSGTSMCSERFALKTRLCTVDKHPANLVCERSLPLMRDSGWQSFVQPCEIHATARAFTKTYDHLMPTDVSGCIHVALALRSSMPTWRVCLQQEINSKMKLVFGHPPPEANIYKSELIRVFISTGSKVLQHKLLAARLPSGDWQRRDELQIYLPMHFKGKVSRSAISKSVESAITSLVASQRPHLFARHRWTGADLAIEELGRLEGLCRLLGSTFRRLCDVLGKSSARTQPQATTSSTMVSSSTSSTAPLQGVPSSSAEVPIASASTQEGAPDSSVVNCEAEEKHRSAELHSHDRAKGLQWLEQKPFGHLVLMRLSMAPLLKLLALQLEMSGWAWEQKQRATAAQHVFSKESGPGRKFMLGVAANAELEMSYFDAIQHLLFNEGAWSLVPEENLTCEFQSLTFRVLARQAALVYADIAFPHKCYPWLVFQCLEQPSKGAELAQMPLCLMCPWSQELCSKYAFQGAEFLEILEGHAMVCATSTALIESKHSSLRRMLVTRSTQTWTMPVHLLSAEHVLQSLRRSKVPFAYSEEDCNAGSASDKRGQKRKAQVLVRGVSACDVHKKKCNPPQAHLTIRAT